MIAESLTGNILVVDDEDEVRELFSTWIARMGHRVWSAPSAEAALDLMSEQAIQVAVCDVRMQGHDGIWLAEQIRTRFHTTSIVLATGLVELDPTLTLRPGVVGYLVKPFTHADLSRVIRKGITVSIEAAARARRTPYLLWDELADGTILGPG